MLGFFLREPEVPKHVPRGWRYPNRAFLCHAAAPTPVVHENGRDRSAGRVRSSSASSSQTRVGHKSLLVGSSRRTPDVHQRSEFGFHVRLVRPFASVSNRLDPVPAARDAAGNRPAFAQEQGTPEDTARAAEPDERLIWHRSRQYTSFCITLATKRNSQHPCPPTVRTDGAHAVPAASERNESDACQDCSSA